MLGRKRERERESEKQTKARTTEERGDKQKKRGEVGGKTKQSECSEAAARQMKE